MKSIKKIYALMLCFTVVFCTVGCGDKALPAYNTEFEGKTVNKNDVTSVIQNALLIDSKELLQGAEATAAVYEEVAKEQNGKSTTYYLVAATGGYFHEDGKLTRRMGNAPFACKITLKQGKNTYEVTDFVDSRTFIDDEDKIAFIEENFPDNIDAQNLLKGKSEMLLQAEKEQIMKNYGFDESEFATGDELLTLLPLTNTAYYTLVDSFPEYPDWIGNIVKAENGIKYTYTTSYSGEDGGEGVVTYIKTDEKGNEIEHIDIKVNGDNVEISEGTDIIDENGEARYTPEELEKIMKEYDYNDGIEYTLVD